MSTIEELLKKQKPQPPTLSESAKDRLFARVLEKEEAMHRPSVQARVRMWFVLPVVSVGALGVAGFVLWYSFIASTKAPAPDHIASTNTNILSLNTSPENVNVTPAVEPSLSRIKSIEQYIFGSGGFSPRHNWTLTTELKLAQEPSVSAPTGVLSGIDDTRVHSIAQVFGVAAEGMRLHHMESGYDVYTTLPKKVQSSLCIEMRILGDIDTPCLFISTTGVVDFEQTEDDADADGLHEAFAYIEALTHITQDQWQLTELSVEPHDAQVQQWTQYSIFPKDELTFTGQGFQVALLHGKLVSLLGSVVAPEYTTPAIDIVSPAEIYNRVREDFYSSGATQEATLPDWVVGYYVDPFSSTSISQRENLEIDIQSITPTSALFRSQSGAVSLFPVYRVRGVVKETQDIFEVLVDASLIGVLMSEEFRYIEHPAQLLAL